MNERGVERFAGRGDGGFFCERGEQLTFVRRVDGRTEERAELQARPVLFAGKVYNHLLRQLPPSLLSLPLPLIPSLSLSLVPSLG